MCTCFSAVNPDSVHLPAPQCSFLGFPWPISCLFYGRCPKSQQMEGFTLEPPFLRRRLVLELGLLVLVRAFPLLTV